MKSTKKRKVGKTTKNTTKSRTNIYQKPQLPLPRNFSMCVRLIEEKWSGNDDRWFRVIKNEGLDMSMFNIICGGVKNNLDNFHLTEELWDKIKSIGNGIDIDYTLHCDYDYRIHLEILRILTGYDLIDILHEGEIKIHNALYDSGEITREMYYKIGNQMLEKVRKNQKLDITTLELKDFNL